jgi:hypothetical protein
MKKQIVYIVKNLSVDCKFELFDKSTKVFFDPDKAIEQYKEWCPNKDFGWGGKPTLKVGLKNSYQAGDEGAELLTLEVEGVSPNLYKPHIITVDNCRYTSKDIVAVNFEEDQDDDQEDGELINLHFYIRSHKTGKLESIYYAFGNIPKEEIFIHPPTDEEIEDSEFDDEPLDRILFRLLPNEELSGEIQESVYQCQIEGGVDAVEKYLHSFGITFLSESES